MPSDELIYYPTSWEAVWTGWDSNPFSTAGSGSLDDMFDNNGVIFDPAPLVVTGNGRYQGVEGYSATIKFHFAPTEPLGHGAIATWYVDMRFDGTYPYTWGEVKYRNADGVVVHTSTHNGGYPYDDYDGIASDTLTDLIKRGWTLEWELTGRPAPNGDRHIPPGTVIDRVLMSAQWRLSGPATNGYFKIKVFAFTAEQMMQDLFGMSLETYFGLGHEEYASYGPWIEPSSEEGYYWVPVAVYNDWIGAGTVLRVKTTKRDSDGDPTYPAWWGTVTEDEDQLGILNVKDNSAFIIRAAIMEGEWSEWSNPEDGSRNLSISTRPDQTYLGGITYSGNDASGLDASDNLWTDPAPGVVPDHHGYTDFFTGIWTDMQFALPTAARFATGTAGVIYAVRVGYNCVAVPQDLPPNTVAWELDTRDQLGFILGFDYNVGAYTLDGVPIDPENTQLMQHYENILLGRTTEVIGQLTSPVFVDFDIWWHDIFVTTFYINPAFRRGFQYASWPEGPGGIAFTQRQEPNDTSWTVGFWGNDGDRLGPYQPMGILVDHDEPEWDASQGDSNVVRRYTIPESEVNAVGLAWIGVSSEYFQQKYDPVESSFVPGLYNHSLSYTVNASYTWRLPRYRYKVS